MDPWLTAALPFFSAAVTQFLGAVVRIGTGRVSANHFDRRAHAHDYVLPEDRGKANPLVHRVETYLPPGYDSQDISKVYAKNGDAATLMTGIVTLSTTWLITLGSVAQPTILVFLIVLATATFICIRLLMMAPNRYRSKISDHFPFSMTTTILIALFLLGGVVAAGWTTFTGAPAPSSTP